METRCFALGTLNTLALLGTSQMYSAFLMSQHCGVGFRNWSLCASPKKSSACSLAKHRLSSPAFNSQVSSHHQSLALLSAYLRHYTSISSSKRAENKQKHFKENQKIKAFNFYSSHSCRRCTLQSFKTLQVCSGCQEDILTFTSHWSDSHLCPSTSRLPLKKIAPFTWAPIEKLISWIQ